jgi:hypothetical protein
LAFELDDAGVALGDDLLQLYLGARGNLGVAVQVDFESKL